MSSTRLRRRALSWAGLVLSALPAVFPSAARAVTIDMVTVGDSGNTGQTQTYANGGTLTVGSVGYVFQIAKYETTIGQYTAFLNAVARSDPNGLWTTQLATDLNNAGIARSGSDGSYAYTAIGPSGVTPAGASSATDRPISYVSWFDAARFANWMANGQPTGPQGAGTTENGAYDLTGGSVTFAPARNATNPNTGVAPTFFIPTEDEWYKAAFYKGGGTNAGYWKYATRSDATPGNTIGGAANQANYYGVYQPGSVGYAVTHSSSSSSTQNYLTEVGAFSGSSSAYGTFDQSGNVWEWNDYTGTLSTSSRGLRGGYYYDGPDAATLSSGVRGSAGPSTKSWQYGFRLGGAPGVSPAPGGVPEIDPNGLGSMMALLGGALGLVERRRTARATA
jgi:sulfatase modifying factor 1